MPKVIRIIVDEEADEDEEMDLVWALTAGP